jgi:hypothetical protein
MNKRWWRLTGWRRQVNGSDPLLRDAYLKQPDSPLDADDWSTPEEFKA